MGKIKDWATIGGLILLVILAVAGWGRHAWRPAPACVVSPQSTERPRNETPKDQSHNGSIQAISKGTAGFVK
ncbi:MAG TPA: hypothetical protein VHD76_07490 [Bryobacteraceae bacterium]|jgi:hypothetical protein|nr:hypothetical protein [Bryobacteraceae bacterium]